MNLVFDIGGKSTKFAVFDNQEIIFRETITYEEIEVNDFLKKITSIVEKITQEFQIKKIGISSPGKINPKTGENSGLSAIKNLVTVNLKNYFQSKLNLEVFINNDAKCAGIAEAKFGITANENSGVGLIIGTGLGGFCFFNKQIWYGKDLMGGEFGYQAVDSNEVQQKNLSQVCGMHALEMNYFKLANQHKSGKEIYEIFEKDDNARKVIELQVNAIAKTIFNLACALNPDVFLIGGAISKNDLFIQLLRKKTAEYIKTYQADLTINIRSCKFGNDANLIGANALINVE